MDSDFNQTIYEILAKLLSKFRLPKDERITYVPAVPYT